MVRVVLGVVDGVEVAVEVTVVVKLVVGVVLSHALKVPSSIDSIAPLSTSIVVLHCTSAM